LVGGLNGANSTIALNHFEDARRQTRYFQFGQPAPTTQSLGEVFSKNLFLAIVTISSYLKGDPSTLLQPTVEL
jgi:hypothetical protein